MRRLEGQRVLVTGASLGSGIGQATARRMAAEGARLFLTDADAAATRALADEIGADCAPCDLSRPDEIADLVERAAGALGGLDGLCNIAGTARPAPVEDTRPEDWALVLQVNLTAPFLLIEGALPWLRRSACASVVNVASASALLPVGRGLSSYVASKAGLTGLSKTLASELGPQIRVNVVCPGTVATALVPESFLHMANDPEQSPYALRRAARPEEIAGAICWLTSAEASYVTGTVLAVDGGRSYH